jgi:D-alanine transaminase
MTRVAYLNGRYLPRALAKISIDDRAVYFGDGVYEVCEVRDGRMIDEERHLRRLGRSLEALKIAWPIPEAALKMVLREVIRRNLVHYGIVYLQISRGVGPRDHGFPKAEVRPSLTVTAKSLDPGVNEAKAARGVKVISLPDGRWSRPDIKTLQLLPNVLAKQAAREAGAEEAWLIDREGFVTEGSSTNAWIVTSGGALVTRAADHAILHGVTRATLVDVVADLGLKLDLRPFTLDEAFAAREAFFSSSSAIAMPIVEIDGHTIGDGRPGEITLALRRRHHELAPVS